MTHAEIARRGIARWARIAIAAGGLLAAGGVAAQTYVQSSTTYNWVATATHTRVTTWDTTLGCVDSAGDDSLTRAIALGFTFTYGSTAYTTVRISSNGRLQFGTTSCGYGTASTGPPRTYPDGYPTSNLLASMKIYQVDLDLSAGGTLTYATIGTAPSRQFIATWNGVPQWNGGGDSYNLQIQLNEDGSFNYMYGTSVEKVNGPGEVGWELTNSDYKIVQKGLPANNSGMRFAKPGATGLRIAYSSYGLFCVDQAATITVVDGSGAATTGYTGTVNLTTTTARGSWLLSSGAGTLTDSVPDDGAATYVWNKNDTSAVFLLRYRGGAAVVTANAVDSVSPSIKDDGSQGAITFSPSGFTVTSSPFSNPAGGVPAFATAQTAGTAFSVYLTAYGQNPTDATCGIITGYAGAKSLKFWSTYVNPATGTLAATVNGSGVATTEAAAAAQAVSFASGQATVTALYRDAGSLSLSMKDDTTGNPGLATGIRGSTGTLVSRPANFVVTNLKRTSDAFANPAASTAAGTVFIGAGQAFTATVTAVESGGAATPNFGRETTPESVKFSVSLVVPASGNAPAVSGTASGFVNGAATGTAFAWPEVGIVKLVPRVASGSYLGSGDLVGAATGNVGRFVPNGFAVALNTPLLGTGCTSGSFSYLGQPLTYTVAPVITVTAQALGGTTTQNYTGSLFRLTNSTLTARTYTPTPASPALDLSGLPATSSDPAIVDLATGQGTLTFGAGSGIKYSRGTVVAPFNANIALGINVIDADGVAASNPVTFGSGTGIGFSSGSSQRYGRLALRNAVGSELLNLPMSLATQYYLSATQGFVTNTADSCTAAPAIAFSGYQLALSPGETCVLDSGSPGASGQGCATAASAALRLRSTASAGDFNLNLSAPGAGNSGAVTVTATAPAWLQYLWNTSSGANSSASGMATFGVFPGPASRVHQREVY